MLAEEIDASERLQQISVKLIRPPTSTLCTTNFWPPRLPLCMLISQASSCLTPTAMGANFSYFDTTASLPKPRSIGNGST
jgi:hypothetical protein